MEEERKKERRTWRRINEDGRKDRGKDTQYKRNGKREIKERH
jgi:hypothetical protein